MRILSPVDHPFQCGNIMKSVRPQILLKEEIAENAENAEDEDIAEYARALGINVKDEEDLVWIAREGLNASLPAIWRAIEDQPSGQIYYFNIENGQSAWEHPIDAHYRQIVEQERQKRLRSRCAEVEPPPSKDHDDGSPSPRPSSPYNIFRPQAPVPKFERPVLRPRGFTPNPPAVRTPANTLQMPPPWAKSALNNPGSKPSSPVPSPDPSPIGSRKGSNASDGLLAKSPSSDNSSHPFERSSSPNATVANILVQEPVQASVVEKPRISEPFPKNEAELARGPSAASNGPVEPGKSASTKRSTDLSKNSVPESSLIEEEEKIRRDNEMYLKNLKENLMKERDNEEKKLRSQMGDELRKLRESITKEKESEEKDIRNRLVEDIRKVKDVVRMDRESQERSIRDAVKADLQKLKDQLEVERGMQERTMRAVAAEDERKVEESLKKELQQKKAILEKQERAELDELRRSMEAEIAGLQESHRKRVAELRNKHHAELEQIKLEMDKLRCDLDKLRMETADESFFKKNQIDALERQKAVVEKQIQDLRQQESDIKIQCETLKEELKSLTKEAKQSEKVMLRLERERTDLEEDMYMLQRAKARYMDRVEQLRVVVGENLLTLPEESLNKDVAVEADTLPDGPLPEKQHETDCKSETLPAENEHNLALLTPPSPIPDSLTPSPARSPSFSRRMSNRHDDHSTGTNGSGTVPSSCLSISLTNASMPPLFMDAFEEEHADYMLMSDCVSGFLNLHLPPSARDSDQSMKAAVPSSSTLDQEKIGISVTPQSDHVFTDAGSFVLRSQLEAIKVWMANRRKEALVFSDPAFF